MSFIQECLDRHNILRSKHGAAPLKISNALNVSAQKWADYLINTASFKHSGSENVGENLFKSWSSCPDATVSGDQAADDWYSEIKDYNFEDSEEQINEIGGVGHFTQLVWDETEYLGVGYVFKDGTCIVVAQYEPAGNVVGSYKKHVRPVGGVNSEVGGSTLLKCKCCERSASGGRMCHGDVCGFNQCQTVQGNTRCTNPIGENGHPGNNQFCIYHI